MYSGFCSIHIIPSSSEELWVHKDFDQNVQLRNDVCVCVCVCVLMCADPPAAKKQCTTTAEEVEEAAA